MESKNMMPLLYDLPFFSALGGLPAPKYIGGWLIRLGFFALAQIASNTCY